MLVDELGRRFRFGVYGVAIADAAILLTRLSGEELEPGFWTLPGGGLDWGEDPARGLEREFTEETGLFPQIDAVLGLHSYIGSRRSQIHVVQVVYSVSAEGTLIHEVGGSTDQAQWWPLREIDQLPRVELVDVALRWAAG